MNRLKVWILTLTCMVLLTSMAQAQIVYEFADSTGTATSSFNINGTGGTVDVRIYLHELTANAPVLNSNGGLGSSAVRLTYSSPSGVAAVTSAVSDIVGAAPQWGDFTTNGSSDLANSAVLNLFSPLRSGVLPDSNGRILLGTFTLHGLTPGSVNLTATDPRPGTNFDTTFFANGNGIDSTIIDGTATLTFTATPEPSLMITIAIAIFSVYCLVWRVR